MARIFPLPLLGLALLPLSAGAFTVSGTVSDSATGKPVFRARVGMDAAHYTLTDSLGRFNLETGAASRISLPDPGRAPMRPDRVPGIFGIEGNGEGTGTWGRDLSGRYLPFPGMADAARGYLPLAKSARGAAAVNLTIHKMAYFNGSVTVAGAQSGLVIRLKENFGPGRYDYLYAGEWQGGEAPGTQKMHIVREGKVVWTYIEPRRCEYDDTWMRSDGSIVFSMRHGARAIRGEKDTTTSWYAFQNVDGKEGTGLAGELHVLQPIGPRNVFMVVNHGNHAKGYLIDIVKKDTLRTWIIPTGGGSIHSNFRHIRLTKEGTLFAAHMDWAKVVEYDTATMKPVWEASGADLVGSSPWTAVKLRNGNALIGGNGAGWVREIDRATKAIVWNVDLRTVPGVQFGRFVQEVSRLSNGNTIVSNNGGHPAIIELTPEKKMVWSVDNLGVGTCFQVLDPDEGVPENPGDLMR